MPLTLDTASVLALKTRLKDAYATSDLQAFNAAGREFLEGIGATLVEEGEGYPLISSVTQEVVAYLPATPDSAADEIMENLRAAHAIWDRVPLAKRQRFFALLEEAMEKYTEHFKVAITLDMGKSDQAAATEKVKAFEWCDWAQSAAVREALFIVKNGKTGEALDLTQPVAPDTPIDIETRTGLGVISGLTSANYPLGLFMGPFTMALISGSSFLYKVAERTPSCIYVMKHAVTEALHALRKELAGLHIPGLPQDDKGYAAFADALFTIVHGREKKVMEQVVEGADELIFIGSPVFGQVCLERRQAVGKGDHTTLELGGIGTMLVMNSYLEQGAGDPAAIADSVVKMSHKAGTDNSGQRCTRLTVLMLQKGAAAQGVAEALKAKYGAVTDAGIGNPFDENVPYGPMIYADGDADMQKVIAQAKTLGAEVIGGGRVLKNDGFPGACLVKPALVVWPTEKLDDPEVRRLLTKTDLFCPLTHMVEVEGLQQGIEVCRELESRLAASLLTRNPEDALAFSNERLFGEVCYDIAPKDTSPVSPHGGALPASGQHKVGGVGELARITISGETERFGSPLVARAIIRHHADVEIKR